MLLNFRVQNFRSIKEMQNISFLAASDEESKSNYGVSEVLDGKFRVLKSTAFYGANASGKSNLYEAIRFMHSFIVAGATRIQANDKIFDLFRMKPFLLDEKTIKEPAVFEIDFFAPNPQDKEKGDRIRFQYGFTVDNTRVVSEWLYAFPHGKSQTWYKRENNKLKPGSKFTGQNESIYEQTGENVLYLSRAGGQLNHPLLKSLYVFIKENIKFISMSQPIHPFLTAELADSDPAAKAFTSGLLYKADTGVKGFDVNFKEIEQTYIPAPLLLLFKEQKLDKIPNAKKLELFLQHTKEDGSLVPFDFETDESLGTQKLFSIAGPWYDCLKNGYTLIVDEFGSSIHPLLARELILLFNSDLNKNGAQIIFNTHDTHLLKKDARLPDEKILRRDQVWFVEKKEDGSSEFYSLSDYKLYPNESLEKDYLAGRYGGTPYLSDIINLFDKI